MLRINLLAVLGIAATVASIANPVSAQSNGKGYTLSGDSLTGINERTANQDFSIFFNAQPSSPIPVNNVEQNTFTNTDYRKTREPVQINNTPVYLEPGQQTLNGNDGLQVQFDLTNTEKRKNVK
ncbi:hypothetical protein [Calothrix sp. CCY 0018]|uniref:hypothetical protein n=1 Tax=Calothrix sp. CCY 0018 TaxID=3103864 RepID=UPI0039C716F8